MAFAFIVEDGSVVANANSYVTVSEADDINVVNIHQSSDWDGLTPTQKEYVISWASKSLDDYVQWEGNKTDEDSAMRWPRCGVTDRDDNSIDDDVIPEPVRRAAAILACSLRQKDRSGEQGSDGVKRVKADVVEIELDENYRIGMLTDDLAFILSGLGTVNTGSGLGFGQITRS